jgi:transcriptional regulator with XRE-family HTH domain
VLSVDSDEASDDPADTPAADTSAGVVDTTAAGDTPTGPDTDPESRTALTFADRLNLLFAAFLRPPNEMGVREQWSNSAMARAIESLHGRQIVTPAYLSQLRRGQRLKPSLEAAAAIARGFEHLSQFSPEPGQQSAIVVFLAIDPETASTDQLAQLESLSDELRYYMGQRERVDQGERFGILARLGDIEDPDSLAEVAKLVTRLRKKERGGGPFGRRRQ